MFCKSNVKKQFFFFLVSLKYGEIITVKTVEHYKKLKKQEAKADTAILLC